MALWQSTFNSQYTKTLQIEAVKMAKIVFCSDSSVVWRIDPLN